MKIELLKKFSKLGGIQARDQLTEEELKAIEIKLRLPLPEDYRQFLKDYGTASFGELVEFPLMQDTPLYSQGDKAPIYHGDPFSHFYGSATGIQSLVKNINIYKGRMPDTIIPIGDDGGGNQICLGIKGEERGKVYYWDHNNEWDEEDYLEDYGAPMPEGVKFQNLYLVAESFTDFILRLEKLREHDTGT